MHECVESFFLQPQRILGSVAGQREEKCNFICSTTQSPQFMLRYYFSFFIKCGAALINCSKSLWKWKKYSRVSSLSLALLIEITRWNRNKSYDTYFQVRRDCTRNFRVVCNFSPALARSEQLRAETKSNIDSAVEFLRNHRPISLMCASIAHHLRQRIRSLSSLGLIFSSDHRRSDDSYNFECISSARSKNFHRLQSNTLQNLQPQ